MYAANMTRPGRPVGVTVLAILQILSGLWDLAVGAGLLILAVLTGIFVGGPVVTLLFLIDFVFIGLGIFSLALAYGLLTGKRWAWTLSVMGAIIGIILIIIEVIGLLFLNLLVGSGLWLGLAIIILIIPNVIILVYLNSGNVRAFFGRTGGFAVMRPSVAAQVGQPYMPPTQSPYPQPSIQQPYYPQPQPAPMGPIACANCGAPNQPGANFCDRCGTRLH